MEEKTKVNKEESVNEKQVKQKVKTYTSKEYEELKEKFEKAMATAAYHQNLSKYYQNEYDKMLKYKSQGLIEELLPVLDSFELAFKATPNSDEAKNYRAGFEFVFKMMMNVFASEGLTLITPKEGDNFNPDEQQIIEVIETSEESQVDTIKEVILTGYKLKERLIRPATVKVYAMHKEEKEEKVN